MRRGGPATPPDGPGRPRGLGVPAPTRVVENDAERGPGCPFPPDEAVAPAADEGTQGGRVGPGGKGRLGPGGHEVRLVTSICCHVARLPP